MNVLQFTTAKEAFSIFFHPIEFCKAQSRCYLRVLFVSLHCIPVSDTPVLVIKPYFRGDNAKAQIGVVETKMISPKSYGL